MPSAYLSWNPSCPRPCRLYRLYRWYWTTRHPQWVEDNRFGFFRIKGTQNTPTSVVKQRCLEAISLRLEPPQKKQKDISWSFSETAQKCLRNFQIFANFVHCKSSEKRKVKWIAMTPFLSIQLSSQWQGTVRAYDVFVFHVLDMFSILVMQTDCHK